MQNTSKSLEQSSRDNLPLTESQNFCAPHIKNSNSVSANHSQNPLKECVKKVNHLLKHETMNDEKYKNFSNASRKVSKVSVNQSTGHLNGHQYCVAKSTTSNISDESISDSDNYSNDEKSRRALSSVRHCQKAKNNCKSAELSVASTSSFTLTKKDQEEVKIDVLVISRSSNKKLSAINAIDHDKHKNNVANFESARDKVHEINTLNRFVSSKVIASVSKDKFQNQMKKSHSGHTNESKSHTNVSSTTSIDAIEMKQICSKTLTSVSA